VTSAPDMRQQADAGARGDGVVRQIIEFALTIAVALVVAAAVRGFLIEPYVVPSGSMLPTIQLQDQVLANKFVYRLRTPQAGEVVVFDNPMKTPGEPTFIKRVIAVGGQTVDLVGGHVLVDGLTIDEPYTYGQPSDPLEGSTVRFPVQVPSDSVWLMGDNRTESKDCRWFGPVKLTAVHGQAFFTYWPAGRIGAMR